MIVRAIFYLFILLLFCACENNPQTADLPIQIAPTSVKLLEGDSILFTTNQAIENTTWTLSPNFGSIHVNGWFKSPNQISTEELRLTLTANKESMSSNSTIIINKRASSKPIVSYAQTIKPIFETNCNFITCHGNGSRAGGVDLSNYDSLTKHLIPFASHQSLIIYSLMKSDPLRRMPPAGPLNASKMESIITWIDQGAKDN